ncbi:MAG: hypothetical protein IT165_36420 [Bryobacterales bacterium]|nr:hypothetical protein [Bryobacterales bacterium]
MLKDMDFKLRVNRKQINATKNPDRNQQFLYIKPVLVNDHDFRSEGAGMAIPYGIYDTQASRGAVFVGASHNTPALPPAPSRGGGCRRAANDTRPPANSSSWQMPAAVTVRAVALTPSAPHSGSLSTSATIHPAFPSGIRSSTACAAKSASG